jgi:hypothetical protein
MWGGRSRQVALTDRTDISAAVIRFTGLGSTGYTNDEATTSVHAALRREDLRPRPAASATLRRAIANLVSSKR